MRAVAALLDLATHAAFGTGKGQQPTGISASSSRGSKSASRSSSCCPALLLFRPWVTAVRHRAGAAFVTPLRGQQVEAHHARVRGRRAAGLRDPSVSSLPPLIPATLGRALLRYLTLTQIYVDNFLLEYAHQGLAQVWSLATEAAFYAALPALAGLLLVVICRGRWQPARLLTGLAALAAVSRGLADPARCHRLDAELRRHVATGAPGVLRGRNGARRSTGDAGALSCGAGDTAGGHQFRDRVHAPSRVPGHGRPRCRGNRW